MKAITLMVTPLVIFIGVSLIFNNALLWQQTYGIDLSQDVSFQIIPQDSLLLQLLTGRFDMIWSGLQTPSANWSILTVIVEFLAGILMLILSLGLTVGASAEAATVGVSNTFGINEQGTKLIQTVGLGLLVWAISASAFGNWLSNFDAIKSGMGTLLFLLLQFVFLIGAVWQSQTQF